MSKASATRVHARPEAFRGDFGALAEMMQRSWAENVHAPQLYTPEFLASCFAYPGARVEYAPTVYDHGKPIAFAGGFPRRIRLHGADLDVLIVAFLTVAGDQQRKGLGFVVWSDLVRRAQAAGLDGVITYCVEGEAMNRAMLPWASRLECPTALLHSVGYMSKLLWPRRDELEREPADAVVEALLAAADPITRDVPLARVWSEPEARWQCTRSDAIVRVEHGAGGTGVLTGYVAELADERRTRCVFVDDVLWGPLENGAREALVTAFCAAAAAKGARIAVVPRLGYADPAPLEASGFRPSRHVVHMYATLWRKGASLEPVSSAYLDVF